METDISTAQGNLNDNSYLAKFSIKYTSCLWMQFGIYFTYHFSFKPYRESILAEVLKGNIVSYKQKVNCAIYDVMYNILLDGYVELTGYDINSYTGQMLAKINSLLGTFDEVFERRLDAKEPLDLSNVLGEESVDIKSRLFQQYLQQFECSQSIISYLNSTFENYYTTYVSTLNVELSDLDFDKLFASIELDSGIQLSALMEVVRLFNEHEPCEQINRDFYALGLAGKLIDDIVDFRRDYAKRRPNLLYMLVTQRENELEILHQSIQKNISLTTHWWAENCPISFNRYMNYIDKYFHEITSSKLKMACDIMFLPAILGHDYDAIR
jgi:hypothetical protein